MADKEVHWSSEAARERYAREEAEARRPPTLAEKLYGRDGAYNGKRVRDAQIAKGVARPSGRPR